MITPETFESLPIDCNQAAKMLSLLGYEPGDRVSLRSFGAKGSRGGKGRNQEATIERLPAYQNPAEAVYVVVNGPGHKDDDIQQGRAFFAEFDGIPHEEQIAKIDDLVAKGTLPPCTFIVKTRNSCHFYWVLADPMPITAWVEYQNRLLFLTGADPSIGNASRVMRLAGSWHTQKGLEPVQVEYLPGSEQRVSESLFLALPAIPDEFSRKVGAHGYTKFDPRALQSTLEALIAARSGGAPESLFDWPGHNFSQRGENDWDGCCPWHESKSETAFHVTHEGRTLWKWYCRNGDCPGNVGGDWVSYQYALEKGRPLGSPKGADIWNLARRLGKESGVEVEPPPGPRKKVADQRVTGDPRELRDADGELIVERLQELTRFRAALDIEKVCPQGLLAILQDRSRCLSVPVEVLFTGLLPTVASLLPPSATVQVMSLIEKPIWWQGWVAESGSRKSPAMRTFTGPLWQMQAAAYEQYQLLHEAWEKEDKDDKTPEPFPRHYLTSDATTEALSRLSVENGMRGGLLREVEELAGLFKGFDQYKSKGGGADQEKTLSLYDGVPIKRDRAKREDSNFVKASAISILGTIQPKVLLDLATDMRGDLSDDNGLWSRFEFAFIPEVAHRLAKETLDHSAYIKGLLQNLERFRATGYTLAGDAEGLFAYWHDEVLQPQLQEATSGFKAYLSKKTGRLARLCLLLHVLDAANKGAMPETSINDPTTVERAIALSDWFTGQVFRLYQDNQAAQGNAAARLQTLADWISQPCRADKWLSARELKQGVRALRETSSDAIRDHMRDLVRLGIAMEDGAGARYRIKTVGSVGRL